MKKKVRKVQHRASRRAEPPCSTLEMARRIAEEIMTFNRGNKSAVKCERIALMKKTVDGEDNLGGRNAKSVIGVVFECLNRWSFMSNIV
ncbi:MAG: hypothetical protein WC455_20405 [Dehalococcoidia bacterium]|jgi:hypothetical protein